MLSEFTERFQKLVYAACARQREICSKQVSGWPNKVKIESEIEEDIFNAPLPTEVDRYYSSKEVWEITEKAVELGMQGNDKEFLLAKFYKEVLSKEYGIKI